jgi:hypothetical protein
MAFDDILVDDVDTIDAARWNAMIADQAVKSVNTHSHGEFNLFPDTELWYIYLNSGTYYAKNMSTGTIDYSGAVWSNIMASVIADIDYAGLIKLGRGTFIGTANISAGAKSIIIEGSGWGQGSPIVTTPGTLIKSDGSLADYLLTFGAHGSTVEGAGIRNLMFANDATNTTCLGAIDLYNTVNCLVEHCYISDFELKASGSMNAISVRGATDEAKGGWNNRLMFNHIVNPDIGILLGANANYNIIEGNLIEGSGTALAYGVKCDGTGASIDSPLSCTFMGTRIKGFSYTGSRGVLIAAESDESGYHLFSGCLLNDNIVSIEIAEGTGNGGCYLATSQLGGTAIDAGDITSELSPPGIPQWSV